MPRLEVVLGEMTQPQAGAIRKPYESIGAGWNPPQTQSRKTGFVASHTPYKRPCCKTCKGEACVGRCKF
jgi:hypothetical protein